MTRSSSIRIVLFVVLIATLALARRARSAPPSARARNLDEYKHFRIAAIDLVGRMPTRNEIADFERDDFDLDRWIEQRLHGSAYSERLTRIYMDLLRLEPNLNFSPSSAQLFRHEILEESGAKEGQRVFVYYRPNQRRKDASIDGEFCFSPAEIGIVVRAMAPDIGGAPKAVAKKLIDERTVLVKPWWLYRDYKQARPSQHYLSGWPAPDPEYRPVESLLQDPDGKPTESIRVCREEAALADTGHVAVTGRIKNPESGTKLPGDRVKPPPLDRAFAREHKGESVACGTRAALENAFDCGCGVGLERCLPNDGNGDANAFYFANKMPLGPGLPLDVVKQRAQRWVPYWWSREAVQFFDDLFESDRDFRDVLTSKRSFVNGPLAQFYRTIQRAGCCGPEANFGMIEETSPLFDPSNVPDDLMPHDVGTWRLVPERSPRAAGILTMPMFLHKYATPRARAAAIYSAFLCKSFVAENVALTPSTEENLMKRPGCQTCHATLEPLAAYFARVEPSSTVFLPAAVFPAVNGSCKKNKNGKLSGTCNPLYDVAFSDASAATLKSAYGSIVHADAAPAGAGQDISGAPEFSECAVSRVASSFLGRPTTSDDASLLASLDKTFKASGYRMRALVRAIMTSDAYRKSNNRRPVREGGVDVTEKASPHGSTSP